MIINNIFLNLEMLRNSSNFIYGDGWNARHMYEIFQRINIPISGYIKVYDDRALIDNVPVVTIDEVLETGANILITQNNWQDTFDKLLENIVPERLFVLANWKASEQCIVCGSDMTMEAGAGFVPFLQERMFKNHKKKQLWFTVANVELFIQSIDLQMKRWLVCMWDIEMKNIKE